MQGTVDRVVANEGFGFIIGPNGEEYFFHRSALKGAEWEEIGPGVPVIFQVTEGEGDRPDEHLRAVDVILAPDAVPAVDNEPLPAGKVAGGVSDAVPHFAPDNWEQVTVGWGSSATISQVGVHQGLETASWMPKSLDAGSPQCG